MKFREQEWWILDIYPQVAAQNEHEMEMIFLNKYNVPCVITVIVIIVIIISIYTDYKDKSRLINKNKIIIIIKQA